MNEDVPWIGLIVISGLHPDGLDLEGAFVNAVAVARSRESFEQSVRCALARYGQVVDEIEESRPGTEWLSMYSVDSTTRQLIGAAERTGQVQFGTFHWFPAVDEPA